MPTEALGTFEMPPLPDCNSKQIQIKAGTTALGIKSIKKDGIVTGLEYDLTLLVLGKAISSPPICNANYPVEGKILTVSIPSSSNQPALVGEVDISALNEGLRHAGSPLQIDPALAKQARACFADNLARAIVEMGRVDRGEFSHYDSGPKVEKTLDTTLGADFVPNHNITDHVTLTSLDAVASIIQQGIQSCKAKKTR